MKRFEGKTALVTGASRGIGLAIAQRLVDEGARVMITARKPEALEEAAAALGGALYVAGRADDADHRAETLAKVASEFGTLDLFVNNAGTNPAYGKLLDIERGAIDKILSTNLVAALDWTRDVVAQGMGQDAAIVNISSISGVAAAPGIAFYGISKAALISLTTQLALELSPGIRVNAVAPAVIKTSFARALYEGREEQVIEGYPLGRLGEPEDVAGPVAFLLSQDAAWITGQTIIIDGGAMLHPIG